MAKVLKPAQAKFAPAAGAVQPRHAHPVAKGETGRPVTDCVYVADNLVTGHNRKPWQSNFPFHEMQVGMAHAAGLYLQADLAVAGFRNGQVGG
jgi:hypothetical protein